MGIAERTAATVAAVALVAACSAPGGGDSGSATGRELRPVWRTALDGAVDGTPAVSNGIVFVGSAGGELGAFEVATGREVWRRSGLGAITDSPAVDSGLVFAGTLTGHVLALHLSDGSLVWDWKGPANAAVWSSPVIYRGVLVIGVASPYGDQPLVPGRVVGLDAATGRERWNMCLLPGCATGDGVWSTAAIDAEGRAFIGVGNPDDGVLAFDPISGERRWMTSLNPDNARDLDVGARPLILQSTTREVVLETGVNGSVTELDATTGKVVWSRRVVEGNAVHGLIASPAFDGTTVYLASASAPTGIVAISSQDGKVVWRHPTDGPVYSAPAIAGPTIAFGTGAVFGDLGQGVVLVLSTADGHEIWRYDAHSAVRSGPAVSGDLLLVGDYRGDLLAFRLSSA